jgi:hypothetical protein
LARESADGGAGGGSGVAVAWFVFDDFAGGRRFLGLCLRGHGARFFFFLFVFGIRTSQAGLFKRRFGRRLFFHLFRAVASVLIFFLCLFGLRSFRFGCFWFFFFWQFDFCF